MFCPRFVWIAQGDGAGQCAVAEGTHRWVIDNLAPAGTVNTSFPCGVGTAAAFCSTVNLRADVVTYSGHGAPDRWARWEFGEDGMACFENAAHPPVVFSHACDTARHGVLTDGLVELLRLRR